MTALLEPGEGFLALARISLADGVEPPDPPNPPPLPTQQPPSHGFLALGLVLSVLSPTIVIGPLERLVDAIVFGRAGRGSAGSHASWLQFAAHRARLGPGLRSSVLVVTDRRFLVCFTAPTKLWSLADDRAAAENLEPVWQVARRVVTGAWVGWHRLNPKRLRIEFEDGSWTAFTMPLAESAEPARQVAAALAPVTT